jgi:hypothetical protein
VSAFDDFIADPANAGEGVVLAEICPHLRLRGWQATEGKFNVWETSFAPLYGPAGAQSYRTIGAVYEDGRLLTEKSSATEVEGSGDSWYWDAAAEKLFVQGGSGNPDTADSCLVVEPRLRFATKPVEFGGLLYEPLVDPSRVPAFRTAGIDVLNGMRLADDEGELALCNNLATFDELYYDRSLIGGRVRLLYGGGELAYADYKEIFNGRIAGARLDDETLSLTLKPQSAALDCQAPPNNFDTDRYQNIIEETVGRPVPLLLGHALGVAPPRLRSKDAEWCLETDAGRFAYITDGAQSGLDVTGDLYLYADIFVPDVEANVYWAVPTKWYDTGNQCAYALIINPQPSTGALKGRAYLELSGDGIFANRCRVCADGLLRGQRNTIAGFYKAGDEKAAQIWINGKEVTTQILAGTLPNALFNSSAQFRLGAAMLWWGGNCYYPAGGKIYEAAVATKSCGGGPPSDTEDVSGWWKLEGGLQDLSHEENHLIGYNSLYGDHFSNEGGRNPIRHRMQFNGTDECAGVVKSSLVANLTTGFIIEIEFEWDGAASAYIGGIAGSTSGGSNNQFMIWLNVVNGCIYWYLSGDGTWTYATQPRVIISGDYRDGEKHVLKLVYNGGTQQIYVAVDYAPANYSLYTGTIPTSLYNSTADFMLAALGTLASPVSYSGLRLVRVALCNADSSQLNASPINTIKHRWRFEPGHVFTSGSETKSADDVGGAHLTLKNCGAENISYQDGGDEYALGDRRLQRIAEVERVYVEQGGNTLELVEGEAADYTVDLEDCLLTVINPEFSGVKVDAWGALVGDVPCGVPGRADSEPLRRASDVILFLLTQVAGIDSGLIDLDSWAAARVGDREVGLFLDGKVNLSQLLYTLCLSGSLLNMVVDDKFRLRRWAPDYSGAAALRTEQISQWEQPGDDKGPAKAVEVVYGLGGEKVSKEAQHVPHLFAVRDIKTFESCLVSKEDAERLAARLVLPASRPPLAARITVPGSR